MRLSFIAFIGFFAASSYAVASDNVSFQTPTALAFEKLTTMDDKTSEYAKSLEDAIYDTLYYGDPEDRAISEKYVVSRAMENDGRACFALYHSPRIIYHLEGEMRSRQYWVKKAYLNGDIRGTRAYAASILSTEPQKAVAILKAQAENGNAGVAVYLSNMEGKRWLPGITEAEIVRYLKIAAKNDPFAMEALAERYRNGNGVETDLSKSGKMLAKADVLKDRIIQHGGF